MADRVEVRRRGLGPEPLPQLGDVAQPAADSLELLVDVDCLAAPAEHGRQVRLALLLEALQYHEPLHEALDEVLGAAGLAAGGLLVLVDEAGVAAPGLHHRVQRRGHRGRGRRHGAILDSAAADSILTLYLERFSLVEVNQAV